MSRPYVKRREPADLHVLPALALVVAAEEAHAVGEEHGARGGGAARQRMAVEHALDLGLAADPAPVFRLLAKADQIGGAILPALAAVAAPHRAIGFERRIDVVGRIGVDIEPHDPAGELHDDPVGQARIGHLAPAVAAILAAVDAGRGGAGIDDPRVLRVDADRPDVGFGIGECQALPARASIDAAIAALGGADIDGVGMFRMDGDRVDLGPFRQPAGQMLPAVLARGLAEDPAQGSAHRPRRAGVNMCRRHDLLPPLKSNGDHTPPPPLAAKF